MAILKLSMISAFGYLLYRRKMITEAVLEFLSGFVVNFTIPFLIFSEIVENFNPRLSPPLWIFLVLSGALFSVGAILAVSTLAFVPAPLRREYTGLLCFQNGGYLPMNIAFFLFAEAARDRFLLYIFFYLIGFNILMWSVGSFFIFRNTEQRFRFRTLFSAPVIGTLAALLAVYLRIADFIPHFILSPVKMIGETSFVLSMIILGSWLAKGSFNSIGRRLPLLAGVSLLKLVIVPFIAYCLIVKFKIFSLAGLFILIQAAMPSAASLPIVVNIYGRQSEFTPQGVFLSHVFSVVTVPIWVGLFLRVSGFSL